MARQKAEASSSHSPTAKQTKQLSDSVLLFSDFFEYVPDAVVIVDDQGQIVRVNNQAELLFGYERRELIGRSVEILLPDRFRGHHTRHREKYMTESRLRPMGANLKLFGYRQDKSEVPIDIMLNPVSGEGQRFVIAVIRDITERYKVEKALQESEAKLRTVFEILPIGVSILNKDRQMVDLNPAMEKILQFSKSELLAGLYGERTYIRNDGSILPITEAPSQRALEGKRPITDVEIGIHIDEDTTIWANVNAAPLPTADEGVVVTLVDITERKEADDKIRASLREKEVMLKEIHHRVKNNLQIVSSLLKLQTRLVEDNHALSILQESRNRIQAMALVHETLYQSNDLASIDFVQYLQQLINYLQTVYGSIPANVTIALDVEPVQLNLDMAVSCGLVVNELVSNALKYAFPYDKRATGEILISLHIDESGRLELHIQDNGVGFPEDLDYHHTETLGLQLVQSLVVDEMDGTIDLEQKVGAHFIITLPYPAFT